MHIEYNLLFVLGNAVEMKYNCTISHTLLSTLCCRPGVVVFDITDL